MPPLHPLIVHAPIVLIIASFGFELAGRALDSEAWRKAAFAMLLIGAIGAGAAVLTGQPAGEHAERQGVPEQAVDQHQDAGRLTLWLAIAAVLARLIAGPARRARGAISALALLLHLSAAVAVAVAGYRGGKLVYNHGAGVRVHGKLVPSDQPPKTEAEPGKH